MLRLLSVVFLVVGMMAATAHAGCEDIASLTHGARLGLPGPQYRLAHCYFDGDGVDQDDAKGAMWMRLASMTGMADALYEMSKLKKTGRGAKQNDIEACALLMLAIDHIGAINASPDEVEAEWATYKASMTKTDLGSCGLMADFLETVVEDTTADLKDKMAKHPKLYEEYLSR